MRRLRVLAAPVLIVGLLTMAGCGKKDETREELRQILDRTGVLSHRFVYTQQSADRAVVVRGLVEDDFRFKARVTLDGNDVLDEVVSDDQLALRFLDPTLLPNFIVNQEDAAEGNALQVLSLRRWVLDEDGAPPLGLTAVEDRVRGANPVDDSLTLLDYVKLAMADAGEVVVFNPESVFYREDEDPFPHPAKGSGVERYDLLPKGFPVADAKAADGSTVYPDIGQFRKLSVYVRDGIVIQVRERVAAEGRILDDLKAFVKRLISTESPRLKDRFNAAVEQLDDEALADFLLDFLNIGLDQAGRDPIAFRTMAYELLNVGQTLRVELPGDVVKANLGFFGVADKAAAEAGS